MDEQTLTKVIKEAIKEEIRPVKELVEVIKKKIDSQELHISVTTENVRSVKEQQSVMNDKLDSHTASLIDIEATLDSYADSYQINQHNIERLDSRTTTIEDRFDINVPEDLKVPHFSSK